MRQGSCLCVPYVSGYQKTISIHLIMLHLLYKLSSWSVVVSRCLKGGAIAVALCLYLGLAATPAQAMVLAALPAGNPITDGKALLRYALPIDNLPVRELQSSLEDINTQLRANRRWPAVARDVQQARRVLERQREDLLASVTPDHQARATEILANLEAALDRLQASTEAKDKEAVWTERAQALDLVGELEEYMVQAFPFQVPEAYQNLPQLKGRATIAMKTERGDLTIVVDGYNAPVTAGNFVDLVQRGFYDGLEFTRAEDGYVLQAGDPPGEATGFIDPKTKAYRAIPLEIRVQDDPLPIYGVTLETAGRYLEQPVLPFSAYGTLAMARPGDDPNGGSSQFFFLLFQPELTPAGSNLLDGRYSVFGYVTEGKEVLGKLKQGDKILSAKVISGAENLEPAKG